MAADETRRTAEVSHATLDPLAAAVPAIERAKRRPYGVVFWLCALFLAGLASAAVLAPILPLQVPTSNDFDAIASWASSRHWLGTDALGRDLFSRVVWGARTSLAVAVAATTLAVTVGGMIGLYAGMRVGVLSTLVMRLMDVFLAFPAIVLAMALVAVLGPSLKNVSLVIGFVYIPVFARVVRASALSLSQREFVLAARSMGISRFRIAVRDVLPNLAGVVATLALTLFGDAVLIEGGLAFLGISVPPPTPSWGVMIAEGRSDLATAPHISLVPVAVLVLVVAAANSLADILSSRADQRGSML